MELKKMIVKTLVKRKIKKVKKELTKTATKGLSGIRRTLEAKTRSKSLPYD